VDDSRMNAFSKLPRSAPLENIFRISHAKGREEIS
jgi:hypothetical protein